MSKPKRFVLESSLEHMDMVVVETERFLAPLGLDEERAYNIVLLATEAVTNAIEHGNGLDPSKSVQFELSARPDYVQIAVEDEGTGFTREGIADPLAKENLLAAGGRGIYLIEELADEVTYENGGRRVVMRFHRSDR